MRELGIGTRRVMDDKSIEFQLDPNQPTQYIDVRMGPGITVRQLGDWGKLPMGTVISGELFPGPGRVYGRFTQAHHPNGHTYPVCMELSDGPEDGVKNESGNGRDTARIVSTQVLRAVKRFK
jgi:serine/threonine-protein kinase